MTGDCSEGCARKSHPGAGLLPKDDDSSCTVSIDGFLQLWPKHLEADCWKSPPAIRLLHALDCVCLTNSVFVAVLLVSVFGPTMNWFQLLQAVLYGVLAVLQLLFMFTYRELYRQHRFKITLVNRLLRLATVVVASTDINITSLDRWIMSMPQAQVALDTPFKQCFALLRQVIGGPAFYLNHANFILPFAYVLVAQLVTFGAVSSTLGVTTCYLHARPGQALVAQKLCQFLKVSMHFLGMLPGRLPREAAQAAAEECQGIEGYLLPALYASFVILVAGPCLFVYFAELNLKIGYIRQRRLTLQNAPPCYTSRLGRAVAIYGAVVGAWMACEVAVWVASPLQCSSTGGLSRG